MQAGGSNELVVVTLARDDGPPTVQDAFVVPAVLGSERESEVLEHRVRRWESEAIGLLVGYSITDREDSDIQRRLSVHRPPADGIAPLLKTFGSDASLLERGREGSAEIVAPAEAGGHEVWRLADDGMEISGKLPAAEIPIPETVQDGALPTLPADLYFFPPTGAGEVWRWRAGGGELERIWPVPDLPRDPRSELRITAPRSDEAWAAGRPPYQVARDRPVVVYALAEETDPEHAVALG